MCIEKDNVKEEAENMMKKIKYAIKAVIAYSEPFSVDVSSAKVEALEILYAIYAEASKHAKGELEDE